MKTILNTILFALILVHAGLTFAQRAVAPYVADEILVKFKNSRASEAIRDLHSRADVRVVENFPAIGWQRVKLPKGLKVRSAIDLYRTYSDIEAVQPNYYYRLLAEPNDPQFPDPGMWGLTKISAPQAWDLSTGSTAVVIANIDTGSRYTHEDLAANMWTNPGEVNNNAIDDDGNGFVDDYYGYDFFFNDGDPIDEHGHGTHTSGTLGAVGNNGVGVVGVNWNVRIMTIKIYNNSGLGTTSAMLINAYNYVRMMKNRGVNIRATNNSYSGCDEACGYDQATKDALDAMGDAGILNVFAAGNDFRDIDQMPAFPASYTSPSILSVAASTSATDEGRAGFSNFGVESVDLAAPGQVIRSTIAVSDSSYGNSSGTSMAAPHAAGAAALLSAYNSSLSAASLKATLMNNVDVLPNWSGVVKTGGRLNVHKALRNQTVCTFDLGKNSVVVPTKGGIFLVNVTSAQNCDYSVKSNVKWLHISGSTTRSGTSAITFSVTVNPTITRSGTLTIAGKTFTVTQSRV